VSHILENVLAFGRALRREGLDVHPGRMLDLVDALGCIDIASREDVYYAARSLLVHRAEQLTAFDRTFDAFWHAREESSSAPPITKTTAEGVFAQDVQFPGDSQFGDERESSSERRLKTWSRGGGVANKDFSACTPEEVALIRESLSRLVWTPGLRRTRRWIERQGPQIDIRRAVAHSRRTAGDLVVLPRRRRLVRPRPLVLLCDVSGSMEQYSRMLLFFAHAVSRRLPRVEAFLFSTRLTRVTRELKLAQPDAALAAMSRAVPDWSGGTQIGPAIREFHQRWARRVLNSGAVVLLISDGWDRGDPEELRDEIARLQRRAHRLIWLNPLIGSLDYAPLTRGLQAALPFVDDFLPARTLHNLGDLAAHLNALDVPRSRRGTVVH
jgi:uncharacterized protein with von Willebrand factor type A (vWA) domain